jgi:hypothetical protein
MSLRQEIHFVSAALYGEITGIHNSRPARYYIPCFLFFLVFFFRIIKGKHTEEANIPLGGCYLSSICFSSTSTYRIDFLGPGVKAWRLWRSGLSGCSRYFDRLGSKSVYNLTSSVQNIN